MSERFLLARIAGRAVAIRSDQVESVVDLGDVVPVPRASEHVRGLAALRSRVVTVIDPAVSLGLDRRTEGTRRAVITRADGHHYAVLVESLDDVEPFELQPLANGLAPTGEWGAAAVGLVDHRGTPVLAIDVGRLLPRLAAAA